MIDPQTWIDKKIGHFVIQSHIQRGGMADVFLANDEWLERPSAIKVLFTTLSSDPDFVQRFQREAKTVARLRHHHIVQIYTTDVTEDGHYYIAMEYVPGGTLQEKLVKLSKEGKLLETPTAIGIVHQIAEALAVAHKAGVVHRDIKPSNVLLREDGTPVLTDLGIAQVQDKPGLTRTNALVGTPAYMSPEQATSGQVDGRSDIYSLGVIFYELFSGRRLFDGDTPWAVLAQHVSTPPRPITEIRPDISYTTWLVLQTCLQKEPDNRYQTAADLLHALDEALVAEKAADQVNTFGTWIGTQPGTDANLLTREKILSLTPVDLTHKSAPAAPTAVSPTVESAKKKRPSWLIPVLVGLLLVLCAGGALAAGPLRQAFVTPATNTPNVVVVAATTPPTVTAGTPTATAVNEALASFATLEAALSATPTASNTPTLTRTATPSQTPQSENTASPTATATDTAVSTPAATASQTNTATATSSSGGSSNPVGNASSGSGLPMGFENFGLWVRGSEANGSFSRSTAQTHSGAASGKIEYDFATADNDYVVFMQNNSISGNPTALQLWVYGDGSGHFLNAWIQDEGRQTWQVPFGRVTHTGWRQMTGYIDTNQSWPWTVISGGTDENVDYPISFRGFVLDDKDNAYTGQGTIYLDDLTATTLSPGGPTPTPSSATPTPGDTAVATTESAAPNTGTVGGILYSSGNILLTTDPTWSTPIELGTLASDTCGSPASTVTGQSFNLYFGPYCGITANGTSVCTAPNGQNEVLTNREGDGIYSISVRPTGATDTIFVYQGSLDLGEGIRWSPVSSSFLFVVGDTVHQAFTSGSYNQIIPTAFEPRFSANGSMILYRKPIGPGINDIFVANSDGSNQHNVTNAAAIDKRCAVWKN